MSSSGIRFGLGNWQRTRNSDQNEPFESENQINEEKCRRTRVAANETEAEKRT